MLPEFNERLVRNRNEEIHMGAGNEPPGGGEATPPPGDDNLESSWLIFVPILLVTAALVLCLWLLTDLNRHVRIARQKHRAQAEEQIEKEFDFLTRVDKNNFEREITQRRMPVVIFRYYGGLASSERFDLELLLKERNRFGYEVVLLNTRKEPQLDDLLWSACDTWLETRADKIAYLWLGPDKKAISLSRFEEEILSRIAAPPAAMPDSPRRGLSESINR